MEGITSYFVVFGPTLLMVVLFTTIVMRRRRTARRRRERRNTRAAAGLRMRRREHEIIDPGEMKRVIESGQICRLALAVHNEPYLVALSYGVVFAGAGNVGSASNDLPTLYFHSAPNGRKLEMLKENPRVCFAIEGRTELERADRPCDWTFRYESVVGYGRVMVVTDQAEKLAGLDAVMRQHGATGDLDYSDTMIARTTILRLTVESMTGKSNIRQANGEGG